MANLPLHEGKAPKWLFDRMILLSSKQKNYDLSIEILDESIRNSKIDVKNKHDMLKRLKDFVPD